MSSRRPALLAVLWLALAPAAAAAPMSDAEIEAWALTHSPILALADLAHDVAEAEYLRASKAWVPVLDLSAGGGYMPGQRTDDDGRLTSDFSQVGYVAKVEADVSLPIYTFGKLALLEDMGEAGRDLADAKEAALRAEVRYQVRRLVATLRYLDEADEVLAEGRRYFDKARDRLERLEEEDSDEYEQLDHFKLKVYEAEVVRRELEAARGRRAASEGLAAVAGLPGPEAVALSDEPFTPELQAEASAEAWEKWLDAGSSELASLGVEARLADLQARLEKRRWFPDIGIYGTAKYQVADPVDNTFQGTLIYDPYNTWYAGAVLGLKWKLDVVGRLAASRKQRALAGLAQAKRDLYRAKLALDVRDLARQLADARTWIETTRRAQKAARAWVVDRSNAYDTGFVPVNEVIEALKEFLTRKEEHLRAIRDHELVLARLRKLVSLAP